VVTEIGRATRRQFSAAGIVYGLLFLFRHAYFHHL
jgi:hypothetical protein